MRILINMEKLCLQCKKLFKKPVNESLKSWISRHKYCSRKCYVDSMKGKDILKKAREKLIGIPVWNKGKKFPEISGEKNNLWKGGEVRKICKMCNKEFSIRPYRSETAIYCSRKCRTDDNLGLTPINGRERKSKKYKDWRTSVFERDNYICQKCGNKNGNGKTVILNVDHIKPFAYYPELRFEISNGVTLCESCHKRTDTFGVNAWRKSNDCVASSQEI